MKKIISLLLSLFLFMYSSAQVDTVRVEQDFIFQNIDKSQIPTGYLNEYGPEVVEKKWLTGILNDSNLVTDIEVFICA